MISRNILSGRHWYYIQTPVYILFDLFGLFSPSITRSYKHIMYNVCKYLSMDFRSKSKFTYSSVLHNHIVLIKVCPCGRYRQLNSVLYHNNHILKSLNMSAGNLKLGKPKLCCFFLQNSTQIPSLKNIYHNICMLIP